MSSEQAGAPSRPELVALRLADPPERWAALGFELAGERIGLGGVELRLGGRGRGITGWSIRGIDRTEIDGLPTEPPVAEASAPNASAPNRSHPNGAIGLDHVVIVTPDFERTAAALSEVGMPLRRIREEGRFRQGFRRVGPAILELVDAGDAGQPRDDPARFWGLVVIVADLEHLAERLGAQLGSIKPAVQPGRRIATLRDSAGLGTQVAFMDPEPAAD